MSSQVMVSPVTSTDLPVAIQVETGTAGETARAVVEGEVGKVRTEEVSLVLPDHTVEPNWSREQRMVDPLPPAIGIPRGAG